ncbi:lipocalin family protein [Soonwooa sp.]|uniref:lipocalin family protein n=1 Tax=Soonwooa sp. TaxID=1938592 RepID=UPI002630A623|nr:lipocalin family protein [Soonwooa sp.]
MKNLLLLGVLGTSLFLTSCKTANAADSNTVSAKEAQTRRAEALKMKGTWEITSVDYDKSYKIKPFDEGADAQCFVGSQWKLIPNNYTGSYTINGGGACPTVTQPISFEVTKFNEFKFKKVMTGEKAKQVTAGYVMELQNLSQSNFTLVQNVNFEGSPIKVYYNFQRVQ